MSGDNLTAEGAKRRFRKLKDCGAYNAAVIHEPATFCLLHILITNVKHMYPEKTTLTEQGHKGVNSDYSPYSELTDTKNSRDAALKSPHAIA